LNLVFLLYAAAPPHRNVGIFALLIGVIASTGLILQVVRQGRSGQGLQQRPGA
jgi:hypothetical protein